MRQPRRPPSDPDEPARLTGSRCPNRGCRFKLVRTDSNGKRRLNRRVRALPNEAADRWYPEIREELAALNRQADEAEQRWGKDSAEYRKAEALIAEKWRESVAHKIGPAILVCPECRTQMDPGDLEWDVVSRPMKESIFRAGDLAGDPRALRTIFTLD
jgi:uncharacterized protein YbaR (Trm112 family)